LRSGRVINRNSFIFLLGTPSWRDGWARAKRCQIAEPMSYQSELVDFLTGHAFGVDDDVTERAPNRVLSVGHFS